MYSLWLEGLTLRRSMYIALSEINMFYIYGSKIVQIHSGHVVVIK